MRYCPNCEITYTDKECQVELMPTSIENIDRPTYVYECPECKCEVDRDDPYDYDHSDDTVYC